MSEQANKRATGRQYEDMAAEYLEQHGHRILARNFSCKIGEIDLITWLPREEEEYWEPDDPGTLVFVEVKYRGSLRFGDAVRAVDYRKQQKIYRVAQYYMLKNHYPQEQRCRFDVIAIQGEQLAHYPNAFGGM